MLPRLWSTACSCQCLNFYRTRTYRCGCQSQVNGATNKRPRGLPKHAAYDFICVSSMAMSRPRGLTSSSLTTMYPRYTGAQPSTAGINFCPGAQGWNVNDLRMTNAHTIHIHNYGHNGSNRTTGEPGR